MIRVRVVADLTIDDSGSAADCQAAILRALAAVHPEARPEFVQMLELPLDPSPQPAWCEDCGGFKATARLHLCRCSERKAPAVEITVTPETAAKLARAFERQAAGGGPMPEIVPAVPAASCPDCQRVIDSTRDGHPNPEGLMEWWGAGHHVCMRHAHK
jgi:hypothetical protein